MSDRSKSASKPFSFGGDYLFILALVIVTIVAYQPAWRGTPIMDDDRHLISAQSKSIDGLVRLWTAPNTTQQYHPLVDTVFWIEKNLWGDSMLGYHMVNILLHSGCALLLWRILQRLAIPGAAPAAALFAFHPVHVESVAWIVELTNMLSGVCFLSAMLAYLKFDLERRWTWYALVVVLFCLGLLAKAIVALLPIAILIVLWWKRGRVEWKRDIRPLLPFAIVGIAAGLAVGWMEREFTGAKGAPFQFSLVERFLIAGRAFWFYLGKLFWPSNLVLIYPRWQISTTDWWQYLFPIAALLVFAAAWSLRQRVRWPLAAFGFFTVMLFPVIGWFNVHFFNLSFVADHFDYLPSLGMIAPVAAGAAILFDELRGIQRTIFAILSVGLVLALITLTWRQSRMYRDAETCYRTILEKNPNACAAQSNLGAALLQRGFVNDAIAHFQSVLEITPNNSDGAKAAHLNLGNALLRKGSIDDAISHFEAALKIAPDAEIHNSLGSGLRRKGRFGEAIAHYEAALKISPQSTSALNNLAWLLATCPDASFRNGSRAVELAKKADSVAARSSPVYLRTLAAAYAETGQFAEAIANARSALELVPNGSLTAALHHELQLYESGLPCYEPQR
jgi:tetratricopeptide (TPR) repeat protein